MGSERTDGIQHLYINVNHLWVREMREIYIYIINKYINTIIE